MLLIPEIASTLRSTERHVYGLIHAGLLRAVKRGKRALGVLRSDLVRFMSREPGQ